MSADLKTPSLADGSVSPVPQKVPARARFQFRARLLRNRAFQFACIASSVMFAWLHITQFTSARYSYPVIPLHHAVDFSSFYNGAKNLAAGQSPYDLLWVGRTPPLSFVMLIPFVALPYAQAADLFQWMTAWIVVGTLAFFCAHFRERGWTFAALLFMCVTGAPYAMFVDRANMDGISMGLAVLAMMIPKSEARKSWAEQLSLVLYALALHAKPQVLLLAPAFVLAPTLKRTFSHTLWILSYTAALFLLTPRYSEGFLRVFQERMQVDVVMWENASIYRAFQVLPFRDYLVPLFLLGSYGIAVMGLAWQRKQGQWDRILAFLVLLPFTATATKTYYHYGQTLFVALFLLYAQATTRQSATVFAGLSPTRGLLVLWLGATGVALTCLPTNYIYNRFGGAFTWVYWYPSFGTFLIVLAHALLYSRAARAFVHESILKSPPAEEIKA